MYVLYCTIKSSNSNYFCQYIMLIKWKFKIKFILFTITLALYPYTALDNIKNKIYKPK